MPVGDGMMCSRGPGVPNEIGRRPSAIDRRVSSDYVIGELLRRGVSSEGVRQLLAGEIVGGARDRHVLVTIVNALRGPGTGSTVRGGAAVDPLDPSGNTIYVSSASGGVWKSSALGVQQFFAAMPITNAQDREALANILIVTLEQAQSRTRSPRRPW
jgi:hypothetical protein